MIEQRRLDAIGFARDAFTERQYFVPMAREHRVRVPTAFEQEAILRRAIRAIETLDGSEAGAAIGHGVWRFFIDYVRSERKRVRRQGRRRRALARSAIIR